QFAAPFLRRAPALARRRFCVTRPGEEIEIGRERGTVPRGLAAVGGFVDGEPHALERLFESQAALAGGDEQRRCIRAVDAGAVFSDRTGRSRKRNERAG